MFPLDLMLGLFSWDSELPDALIEVINVLPIELSRTPAPIAPVVEAETPTISD